MARSILNTIALVDKLNSGYSQSQLIPLAHDMGFDAIELRDEFLQEADIPNIVQLAEQFNTEVYYSVNEPLIKDGHFNQHFFNQLKLSQELHTKHLKMNIGSLANFDNVFPREFSDAVTTDIALTVENNQSSEDSNLNNTLHFFEIINSQKMPITFCFDTANWLWVNTDPMTAIEKLAPNVSYLHLKNASNKSDILSTTQSLESGAVDIPSIISKCSVQDYGFEYQSTVEQLTQDLVKIKSITKAY